MRSNRILGVWMVCGFMLAGVSCGSGDSSSPAGDSSDASAGQGGASGAAGQAGSGAHDAGADVAQAGAAQDASIDKDAAEDVQQDVVQDTQQDTDVQQLAGIHASPDGTGSTCSMSAPCSLASAQSLARVQASSMTGDLTVWLHDGTYRLSAPLVFRAADSGSGNHVVRYEALPGARPVLSGGLVVTGWTLTSNNIYRASVPASLDTRQLYVNGRRAQRARGLFDASKYVKTSTGYTATTNDLAKIDYPEDVEAVQLAWWKNYRCHVASALGTTVLMADPCWSQSQKHTNFAMGAPNWFENALEFLDQPGEWFLDKRQHKLYYKPRPGEDMTTAQVVAPALEALVQLRGTVDKPVHHLAFKGLTFADATWLTPSSKAGYPARQAGYFWGASGASQKTPGNVQLHYADDVRFQSNIFTRLGAYGVALEDGCHRVQIVDNHFSDISSGAIRVADVAHPNASDPREVVTDASVFDNVIEDTGREFFDSVGVFVGYATGTKIEHNELRNLPYTGISVGWGWSLSDTVASHNTVAYNKVRRVMQRMVDGGCVYALGKQPSSVLARNDVHDQLHNYGALYLDQGSKGWSVHHNVVSSVPFWFQLQPVVPPAAQGNSMTHNYADTSKTVCQGSQGNCTAKNTVADNTVVSPGAWPAEARFIMGHAGLSPSLIGRRTPHVRVEAESYLWGGEGVGYHDMNSSNEGGVFRNDGVDIYFSQAASNDHVVGYIQEGEWLRYQVDIPAPGLYNLSLFVGTKATSNLLDFEVDGHVVGTAVLPNTGSWSKFEPASIKGVYLNEGRHQLRLLFHGTFVLDAFDFTSTGADTCASGSPDRQLDGDFDGDGKTDSIAVHGADACWQVKTASSSNTWLRGWGDANRMFVGDFDGNGLDDLMGIDQSQGKWMMALSTGNGFEAYPEALVGWGGGTFNVVGDLDGDGKDDVAIVWHDQAGQQWRWHVAMSLGHEMDKHADALTGVNPGNHVCAKDVDGDGTQELVAVTNGSPGKCYHYDKALGKLGEVAGCSASCP